MTCKMILQSSVTRFFETMSTTLNFNSSNTTLIGSHNGGAGNFVLLTGKQYFNTINHYLLYHSNYFVILIEVFTVINYKIEKFLSAKLVTFLDETL